jgi:ATP-dependent DNA ligase
MAWLKYKINKAQAFVIGGHTPDNPLDAAIVGYYEGDKLMFVSKVWNDFVPRLRREVWSKLKQLRTATFPLQTCRRRNARIGPLSKEQMHTRVDQTTLNRADQIDGIYVWWTPAAREVLRIER